MQKNQSSRVNIVFVRRASNYIKDISIEGGILTIILCCTFLFLLGSIFRVINNAKNNYEIFNIERDNLSQLQEKNGDLKDELGYVTSDEYKKLFLRDTKGLTTQSEELYRIREEIKYFKEEKEYLELSEKNNYSDWWLGLIN